MSGSHSGRYKGNPIYDDCMIAKDFGFECPGGGLKYPENMRAESGTYCKEYDG